MPKKDTKKEIKNPKAPSSSKKEPQTMDELLATTGYKIHGLKRGETVVGTVVEITHKAVLIDIGAKNEGVVMERGYDETTDFIKTLKVGQKVTAQVISPELESGQILLSVKRAAFSLGWQKLLAAKSAKEEIEVLVKEVSRAGLMVEAYNLPGFIPISQVGSSWRNKLDELVGKKIKVQVKEVDETQEKLVLSEKAVSEKEQIQKAEETLAKIELGDEYAGTVSGVTPFGVFVQVKEGEVPLEGLVHISEVAWEKMEDPLSLFQIGQTVKVKVIGVEKEAGRLALSLRQMTSDPWLEKIKKYPLESHVSGTATKLTSYGLFVEIEPGITGLIHISKIPTEMSINVGDAINCFVEAVEPDKRRLSLGLVLKEKPVGYK